MSVNFKNATPVLRVDDLQRSIDYYVSVLGFKLDWSDDDGNSFASVSRDHCHLFLCVGDQGHPGSWMWIGVSDVDVLHDELRGKSARIRIPPGNYRWGSREMHVEDPDGNVLRFGSENKPGEPWGDWLDMRSVRWRRGDDGGWMRVE